METALYALSRQNAKGGGKTIRLKPGSANPLIGVLGELIQESGNVGLKYCSLTLSFNYKIGFAKSADPPDFHFKIG
jgi:hypothetical protein